MPGIDIRRSLGVPVVKRPMVGSSRHKAYLDVALFIESLRQAIEFNPDVIHAHLHEGALIGSVIGKITRTPVVFDYQGSLTEEMLDHKFLRPGGKRERFFRVLEGIIDRMPEKILPSSIQGQQHLLNSSRDPGKVQLLADAVDLERFNPSLIQRYRIQMRSRLGIPADAPVAVYLGLLAEYQGTPLLIDAARELLRLRSDFYVVVAGYPATSRHAAMAVNMPVEGHVLFPGRISYKTAPALLSAADVAVAPKLSVTEGNGKLFNYMAMGLPVVAIDNPVNRQIAGPFGHYVPPGDPEALAQAILDALDDPPETSRALYRRVATDYSWSQRVQELISIYDEVTTQSVVDKVENINVSAD